MAKCKWCPVLKGVDEQGICQRCRNATIEAKDAESARKRRKFDRQLERFLSRVKGWRET